MSYKKSKLPINDRNNRIIRKTYLSEWGKRGNDWAIVGQIGHSVQWQVVRKLNLVVRKSGQINCPNGKLE